MPQYSLNMYICILSQLKKKNELYFKIWFLFFSSLPPAPWFCVCLLCVFEPG